MSIFDRTSTLTHKYQSKSALDLQADVKQTVVTDNTRTLGVCTCCCCATSKVHAPVAESELAFKRFPRMETNTTRFSQLAVLSASSCTPSAGVNVV